MLAAHIADENPLRTWAFEALEEAMQIAMGKPELQQLKGVNFLQAAGTPSFLFFKNVSVIAYSLYPIAYSTYTY